MISIIHSGHGRLLSRRVFTLIAFHFGFITLHTFSASPKTQKTESLVPYYKYTQTITASADLDDKNYVMDPFIMPVEQGEMLIGYKRGYAHLTDQEAVTEILRYNPATERIVDRTALRRPGIIFQNGEFTRYANGDIACFIDMQEAGPEDGEPRTRQPAATLQGGTTTAGVLRSKAIRLGVLEFRSSDGGHTWKDHGKLGLIDGVEYGYVFEAITEGKTTWLLVMRFTNLQGGIEVDPQRPHAGSVDVIRTEDNGNSWRLVRNLTEECGGISINESSFIRYGEGFLVAARGYDNRQWLIRTDRDFGLIKKVDITADNSFVQSYVGRPRVFERDGGYYLIGRNWDKPPFNRGSVLGYDQEKLRQPGTTPMKLSMFRFDPVTLAITKHVILDNAEEENVIDGYYAVPYWQERRGTMYLNTIIYKRMISRNPDIVRLEFDWEEVR
ncbi:MAG: hypothetical protein O3C20_07935 [Verrucomicrobia bacterium]|nr:hypothetical protein [Verrucomicrobiota bacterium]